MPLQNRVDPIGSLHAIPSRGSYTGNRGVIHNDKKQIIRNHATKRWIYCLLKYKDHKRKVMTPRRWTELFFLDDATALAAGHRPCGYCQREKYNRFITAWRQANNALDWKLNDIDAHIHKERMNRTLERVDVNKVPDGTIIRHNDKYYLKSNGELHLWSFDGYKAPIDHSLLTEVELITPESILRTISQGFNWLEK